MDIFEYLHTLVEQKNWELGKQFLQKAASNDDNKENFDELLHFAAFIGDVDTIKILLSKDVDINYKNENDLTALHFAVSSSSKEISQMLPYKSDKDGLSFIFLEPRKDNFLVSSRYYFNHMYNNHAAEKRNKKPFHILAECYYIGHTNYVIEKIPPVKNFNEPVPFSNLSSSLPTIETSKRESNIEVIELLLNSKANINSKLKNGETPLHMAVESGNIENIKTILQFQPDINCSCFVDGSSGYTPLHFASRGTNDKIVELLIDSGADVDAVTSNGMTALHLAIEAGFINTIKTLLKFKPNLSIGCTFENEHGYTPLHFAAKHCNEKIVEMLINSGAETNETTENGKTALHIAVKQGHIGNYNVILNCNPHIVNYSCKLGAEEGYTPLHFAAIEPSDEIFDKLLSLGVFINAKTNTGKTALMLAVEKGQVNKVKLLLKYNPDVNCFCSSGNEEGYTALHFAAKLTNEEIIKILLNSEGDVKAKSRSGKTCLHLAVENDRVKNVRCILAHHSNDGVLCNLKDDKGYCPLHYAAIHSNEEVIGLLLKSGAMINAVTMYGKTPLHLAVEYSCLNNVKTLLIHKADVNSSSASGDEEGYTRFVFDSDESSEKITEKLLQNQDHYYYLHFFSKDLTDSEGFEVCIKYKPVVNCKQIENTRKPIHFTLRGNDNIVVVLRRSRELIVTPNELYSTSYLAHSTFREDETNIYGNILEYIPDSSCSCTSCFSEGYTPLHFASRKGNQEIIQMLLNNGANINARTLNGESALYLAVESGNIENIEILLKYKPDINQSYNLGYITGYSPLHSAAAKPDSKILEILLKNGANLNVCTSNGESPLFPAVKLGRVQNIITLLKHGLDFENEIHRLAFFYAVTKAKKNISNIFENCDFTTTQSDINNIEILYHCIAKKCYNIFYHFLKFGVDVNSKTINGDTVLNEACRRKDTRVFNSLLEYNVNVNSTDKRGDSALHISTDNQNTAFMIDLLQHGVNVNIQNERGFTPLNIACKNYNYLNLKSEDCIKILLEYKPDINSQSKYHKNPLCHLTSKTQSYDLVKLLLEMGADVNIRNENGDTALHVACKKCDNEDNCPEKYIELLLKYGAKVNDADFFTNTPLHIVCKNYLERSILHHKLDRRIVTLLEHGSDIINENHYNQTPITIYIRHYLLYRETNRNIPEKFINTTIFLIEQLAIRNLSHIATFLIDEIFRKNCLYSEEVRPLCDKLRSHLCKCEKEISHLKEKKFLRYKFLFCFDRK